LFGNAEGDSVLIKIPDLPSVDDWVEKERLCFEKEVLGLYVTGHPLLEHSEDLEEFTTVDFTDKFNLSKNETITVGGMITRVMRKYDRRNRPMAFFEMDCIGGHVEVIAFSGCFAQYEGLIENEKVVFVRGKPSDNSDFSDLKVIADEIFPVEKARVILSGKLVIRFNSGEVAPEDIDKLFEVARS